MNKAEAAEYIGVSVRTLQRIVERKTKQGTYTAQYQRGSTGQKAATFEPATLDEWKREREEEASGNASISVQDEGMSNRATSPVTPGASLQLANLSRSAALVELLTAIEHARAEAQPIESIVDLAHKLVLTEKEAARFTGLPLSVIRANRAKLKARIIGRGYKVKREALEAFVRKF
jgi:hypothetical protein